jgi:hypothetical protein
MMKTFVVKLAIIALCAMSSPIRADFLTGFEAPAYTAGANLPGQNGWYIPVAGSVPYDVLTYAGNPLGLPANPNGGAQFAGGASGATFARSQLDFDFSGSSIWTLSYDVAHRYNGSLPSAQNLASFSTQNPNGAYRSIIALHTWTDVNTADAWNAQFNVYDAAGAALNNQSPGAAWENLLLDNWYRESFTFDLSTNRVLSVSLTNLTTSITNTFDPSEWYLNGGSNPVGLLDPTAFRIFAGGAAGNVAGWDNMSITAIPEPSGSLVLLSVGVFGILRRQRTV